MKRFRTLTALLLVLMMVCTSLAVFAGEADTAEEPLQEEGTLNAAAPAAGEPAQEPKEEPAEEPEEEPAQEPEGESALEPEQETLSAAAPAGNEALSGAADQTPPVYNTAIKVEGDTVTRKDESSGTWTSDNLPAGINTETMTLDGSLTLHNDEIDPNNRGFRTLQLMGTEGKETSFTVNGDVGVCVDSSIAYGRNTVSGEAVYVEGTAGGQGISLEVNGDVIAQTGDSHYGVTSSLQFAQATGVHVKSNAEPIDITVNGTIQLDHGGLEEDTTCGERTGSGISVDMSLGGDTVVRADGVNVTGNVSPRGVAIHSEGKNGGSTLVEIGEGGIQATDSGRDIPYGAHVWAVSGECELTVDGNITAESKYQEGGSNTGNAFGIWLESIDGAAAYVKGDVSADGYRRSAGNEKEAKGVGVSIYSPDTEVIVEGTISGNRTGVLLADESLIDSTNITAWKVEGGEDGSTTAYVGDFTRLAPNYDPNPEASARAAAAINYILRVDTLISSITTPVANLVKLLNGGETISETKATVGEKNLSYFTAHAGDTVRMQVGDTISVNGEEYKVDSVKKVELDADGKEQESDAGKDDNGYFWAPTVAANGGWWLRLNTHKHEYTSMKFIPSCTEGGYTLCTCKICGASYKKDFTDPCGHDPSDVRRKNVVEPKPGQAGSYDEVVYCSICGLELKRTTIMIDPLPEPHPEPKPEPDPEPAPVPDPAPAPAPAPADTARTFTLKFFEDAQAAAKSVTVQEGQVYTLPDAPEKEGQTFVGWAESDIAPTDPAWQAPAEGDDAILAPGFAYQVTGSKCFIGIWK